MPIENKTSPQSVSSYINKFIRQKREALIKGLCYVGEECLKAARNRHKYLDRTGNLTSSIGYCIIDNGRIVNQSNFEQVKEGTIGKVSGSEYLQQLIVEHPAEIVFIMVAGMPYAAYVEAMGLDVFGSAEELAKNRIPRILKKLGL